MRRRNEGLDLKTSRVFLKALKYFATIKLVSKDTKAKEFRIVIDPEDLKEPVRISK